MIEIEKLSEKVKNIICKFYPITEKSFSLIEKFLKFEIVKKGNTFIQKNKLNTNVCYLYQSSLEQASLGLNQC